MNIMFFIFLRLLNMNMPPPTKILIANDEPLSVGYLEQELEDFGSETISTTNVHLK